VEANRVLRRRGFNIFQKIGSQMAVRLSALRAGWPPFIPRDIVLLEGLDELKISLTSFEIESATFWLVA
jgi:hypothetical protein